MTTPLVLDPGWLLTGISLRKSEVTFAYPSEPAAIVSRKGLEAESTLPLAEFLDVMYARTTPPAGSLSFIFMTDFCGSTLLLRCLESLHGVYALNEPLYFAQLALAKRYIDRVALAHASREQISREWREILGAVTHYSSRRFDGQRVTTIVKESPPTNYLLSDLLNTPSAGGVGSVVMYGRPKNYFNSIFRQSWRRQFVRDRLKTLSELAEWPLVATDVRVDDSDPTCAAAHWFLQAHVLARQIPTNGHRIALLEEDELYADPMGSVAHIAAHMGIAFEDRQLRAGVSSARARYSKNAGRAFSERERQQEKQTARRIFGREIEAADARLQKWLIQYPLPANSFGQGAIPDDD